MYGIPLEKHEKHWFVHDYIWRKIENAPPSTNTFLLYSSQMFSSKYHVALPVERSFSS